MKLSIIPYNAVPGGMPLPSGLSDAVIAAGSSFALTPDGVEVSNVPAAVAIMTDYRGSATEAAHHKALMLAELAELNVGKYAAGFRYTGPDGVARTFQLDATSQFNIDVQANAALGAILAGEDWDANSYFIAADNSHMPTPTAKDMRNFALAVRSYVAGLILNNRATKDAVAAAPDMAAVKAIDIKAGWPSDG